MELKLVSFVTAKMLKKIGFDLITHYRYPEGFTHLSGNFDGLRFDHNNNSKSFSAPSLSLVQMWLREKYNINIVCMQSGGIDYYYTIYNTNNANEIDITPDGDYYDDTSNIKNEIYVSYEEALEAGIVDYLELKLKNHDRRS